MELIGSIYSGCSGRDTATSHGVLGEQIVCLQILHALYATQRHAASAIRRLRANDASQIGILALHGNQAPLFVTAQIANVVGDGWNVSGAFTTRHVADGHFE